MAERPQRLLRESPRVVPGVSCYDNDRVPASLDRPSSRTGERRLELARVPAGVPHGREDRHRVVAAAIELPAIAPPAGGGRVGPPVRIRE